MKREDLKALELSDDQIEKIMVLNGKAIEANKTAAANATAELETVKTQLTEANKQIEDFKGMDVDGIKKAADEWKSKFETAEKEHSTKLATMQFETELDTALAGAKVKNAKAVKALLSSDDLRDAAGKFIPERLASQIEKIKTEADYLFESDAPPPPTIVKGGNNQTVVTDALEVAMRQGAGLTAKK